VNITAARGSRQKVRRQNVHTRNGLIKEFFSEIVVFLVKKRVVYDI